MHWGTRYALGILVLNVFDAVTTWYLVGHGYATEVNPLMGALLSNSACAFFLGKTLLVLLGVVMLWLRRENRLGLASLRLAFVGYLLLGWWEVISLVWVNK